MGRGKDAMLEDTLLNIIKINLEKILEYNPYYNFPGISSNDEFSELIKTDPAFSPFGLERKEYVLARFGGNLITSLHRKLGDAYEDMFTEILSDRLGIPKDKLKYSLTIQINDEMQVRSTDGLVLFSELQDPKKKELLIKIFCESVEYKGFAHEVRSCYQIGDSKRIQADRDMGLALRHEGLYPVMIIFCKTSLRQPVNRLKQYWDVKEGNDAFKYIETITKFNLQKFLEDNKGYIQGFMTRIFDKF